EAEMTKVIGDIGKPAPAGGTAAALVKKELSEFRDLVRLLRTGTGWDGLLSQLSNLFAAMLGASFYTLYTANRFVVDRTFDRAYTTHYVVRFVLGIVAGVILANFGEYLLTNASANAAAASGTTSAGPTGAAVTLTQTVLALIGGYSADAVNAIFTRVAETLTTAVRGSSGQRAREEAQLDVKKAESKAKVKVDEAERTIDASRHEETESLRKLLSAATEEGVPTAVADQIRARLKALGENV
ncbi:MAG: hypothetical protein ACOYN0_18645, partial [Phycisphaerales bacterium]